MARKSSIRDDEHLPTICGPSTPKHHGNEEVCEDSVVFMIGQIPATGQLEAQQYAANTECIQSQNGNQADEAEARRLQ
jgi:hypothetical protein